MEKNMNKLHGFHFLFCLIIIGMHHPQMSDAQTIALWLFDEQQGLYPSHVLSDHSDNNYPLVIGPGGQIVPGKFGNALEATEQPVVDYPSGEEIFGLKELPVPEGRTVPPLTWMNSKFCALMTSGELHLRKETGFARATATKLNLGAYDWTLEFWFKPTWQTAEDGVVFEIGEGPRGENDRVTRLVLDKDLDAFRLYNFPTGTNLVIPTHKDLANFQDGQWHHIVFTYDREHKKLLHWVDGKKEFEALNISIESLPKGEEDYFCLGRDGLWNQPLQGTLDEMRFSEGIVYKEPFKIPQSLSPFFNGTYQAAELKKGLPLLFNPEQNEETILNLGGRKHLFIDDAIISEIQDVTFTVNPPRQAERVIEGIEGPFRKHLTIIEDEDGLIRLYNSIHEDRLAIRTSTDGIHWEIPDVGKGTYRGQKNIIIPEAVGGLGNPFIDPNGPPEYRWKYLTGYHNRGIFLYTSPDGWNWTRQKTAHLPFRSGTQSCTFYDDQRQVYVGYHRTGINHTVGGATQRESVVAETKDLFLPMPFKPVTMTDYEKAAEKMRLRDPLPWYLDNGPLTCGGFGLEFPHKFAPIDTLDPPEFDIYVTKALKYPWAPDTYLAFPIAYFHYEVDTPQARLILMDPQRGRGSGPIETQLSVSRDGLHWQRYPRPAYVGNGKHTGWPVNQAYMAHGLVRRGNEIWQYYFGTEIYHSSYNRDESKSAVYRVVQRLDGFVSADTPYDREGYFTTRPLTFAGNRLVLNIDTDATGYTQVGFMDENGNTIEGFELEKCIYINGDFIEAEVEWLGTGMDVAKLSGKTVRLVFRMRGSKLYAMQFVQK